MQVYIPAESEREARNSLIGWGYDRNSMLLDIVQWGWFRVYVFDVQPVQY